MKNRKSDFELEENITYFNAANISPLMREVAIAGKEAIDLRTRPYKIDRNDWFEPTKNLKKGFAKLIGCNDFNRIALIPSVSYGIATAAKNISLKKGDEVLIVDEQYPSNYYSWKIKADRIGAKIRTILPPEGSNGRGMLWNEKILDAINDSTKVVAIANVHWTDGTLFDLVRIGEKVRKKNALLIIDGSQSVGALPFDIKEVRPDALFTVGYKWLMGPFSLGMAYYGSYFDGGKPIEENWINRKDGDDFQGLVDYTDEYGPLAGRYNVGENSNFHLVPILAKSIEKLNEIGIGNIQAYTEKISRDYISRFREMGCIIEDSKYRCNHILGIRFNDAIDLSVLNESLAGNNIFASLRGSALRVSLNIYNDESDLEKLYRCIKDMVLVNV